MTPHQRTPPKGTESLYYIQLRTPYWAAHILLRENPGRMDHDNDDDIETLRQKLVEYISEHRDLDDVIARISETAPFNQIQIKRLKKRKLLLKDQITRIESRLLPDIIA